MDNFVSDVMMDNMMDHLDNESDNEDDPSRLLDQWLGELNTLKKVRHPDNCECPHDNKIMTIRVWVRE